ncbi:MAG: outer membrane protein assembly factor BamB family protein [Planctomycetota bacterium]|jgi:outer membrane protein assembly factor BamB
MNRKKAKLSKTGLRHRSTGLGLFVLSALALTLCRAAAAEDWPTHLHDNHRSGATNEQLLLPLVEDWVHTTNRRPRPAWDETPALQNFWGGTYDHKSRVNTDDALAVVSAGDSLYFGSSNSNKVVCLDVSNGSVRWKYFAGGPVRLAPSLAGGNVFFGSDDGYAYCLNAADGTLVWKKKATTSGKLMFINGRMVSECPVRTDVMVEDDVAYWAAGLFSGAKTGLSRYLCAYNARTGSEIWKITPPKPIQGYLLASTDFLYAPAGKSTPTYYRRSNGEYRGSIGSSRQGGTYAVLSRDNKLSYGPHYSGNDGSYIGEYNTSTGEMVAWAPANHLVVTDAYSYYSSDTVITKIRRSDKVTIWSVPSSHPCELILAGNTLFAGSNDEVAAIDASDGDVSWTAPVNGRVRDLAAANGRLFVSTDLGAIHSFKMPAPGDLNIDGEVNGHDFARFARQWGKSGCGDCDGADLAGNDDKVNGRDLAVIAESWLAP